MKLSPIKLSQDKIKLYTELNVNSLESLTLKVAEGSVSPKTIARELEQISKQLREINNNFN